MATIIASIGKEKIVHRKDGQPSPYMKELISFLGRLRMHTSQLGTSLARDTLASIVDSTIERWLVRASLERDLDAKKQLCCDLDALLLCTDSFEVYCHFHSEFSCLRDSHPTLYAMRSHHRRRYPRLRDFLHGLLFTF